MGRINNFAKWFLYITTGVLFVCAVNMTISGIDTISVKILWQILLSGFLTALVTVFFEPGDSNKKTVMLIQFFLHYALLCIVMMILGNWFGWMKLDLAGIVMMMVSVAVVYSITFISYRIIDVKQADEINKKLKEKYGDK